MSTTTKKRVSRRGQLPAVPFPPEDTGPQSLWQALNEPIIQVSPKFAQGLLVVAVVLLGVAWVGPYLNAIEPQEFSFASPIIQPASAESLAYQSGLLVAPHVVYYVYPAGVVAGAKVQAGHKTTASKIVVKSHPVPVYGPQSDPALLYKVAKTLPMDLTNAFSTATIEVLDLSGSLKPLGFLHPGISAVWNAWLDLMQDPHA